MESTEFEPQVEQRPWMSSSTVVRQSTHHQRSFIACLLMAQNLCREEASLAETRGEVDRLIVGFFAVQKYCWYQIQSGKWRAKIVTEGGCCEYPALSPDYFFVRDFTLVSMPKPIAWSCSRPCFACAPYGPFGSSSMHFW